MKKLTLEQKEWLEEEMVTVLERLGEERYLRGPIVLPTERFFPDTYRHGLAGVRTVARRTLSHVGLGDLKVEARGAKGADLDELASTSLRLSVPREGEVHLVAESIGRAEDVPLVLAHEVGLVALLLNPAASGAQDPYRSPPRRHLADDEEGLTLEKRASLAAHALGLGLLVTKAAHQYRASGTMEGSMVTTRWVHLEVGALEPGEHAYLLAMQAALQDLDAEAREALCEHLGPDEKTAFQRELKALRREREELAARLGIDAEALDAEPIELRIDPLPEDGWRPTEPEEERDEEERAPIHEVARVPRHWGWVLGFGALVLSLVAAGASGHPAVLSLLFVGSPILMLIGFFVGRTLPRSDRCSRCEAAIPVQKEHCPGCGGLVYEEPGASRARAKGADKRGSGSEPEPDPDPCCPYCRWVPDGEASWSCQACGEESFDAFEMGGECPGCGALMEEVDCKKCGHLSAYELWWPGEG